MPSELENLLDIARIKYLAKAQYINKIASRKTAVVFTFEQSKFDIDIPKLVEKYKNRLKFSPGVKPMITLEIGTTNERQILNDVTELLRKLSEGTPLFDNFLFYTYYYFSILSFLLSFVFYFF